MFAYTLKTFTTNMYNRHTHTSQTMKYELKQRIVMEGFHEQNNNNTANQLIKRMRSVIMSKVI